MEEILIESQNKMSDKQMKCIGDIQVIRGYPFPKAPSFPTKNIEDAIDYIPMDDDVIITSYPKTGSTWVQYIVLQIVSKGEFFPSFDDAIQRDVPFVEMSGIAAIEALKNKPRIYRHHIPYTLLQKNLKSKFIYTYRHPEDVVTSYYYFMRSSPSADNAYVRFEFDHFFEAFVSGNIWFGNYFRHVLSCYEHSEDSNVLMVSYEKLHNNRKQEILRIAKFLGSEYRECLTQNEKDLSKILEHTTFEYMKKNLHMTLPGSKLEDQSNGDSAEQPKVNFFRKGIVGDGKTILTTEQRNQIKEEAQKILNGTSILDEWYPK